MIAQTNNLSDKIPAAKAPSFNPPGPGGWERDFPHFPRPVTPFLAEFFPIHFVRGFARGAKRMGVFVESFEWKPVNGVMYMKPRPVAAPAGAVKPPPKPIFRLLAMLHPEIRRRVRVSAGIYDVKLWREDLSQWDDVLKPAAMRANRGLQGVDLASLDTDSLLAHLEGCKENACAMMELRGSLTIPCLMPIGDFIARGMEWTGAPAGQLMQLLRGSSPLSTGLSEELEAAGRALREDVEARKLLVSGKPAAALIEELRAWRGSAGDAVRGYIALVAYRLVGGYDMGDKFALELPGLIVAALENASQGRIKSEAASQEETRKLREKVPPANREAFDLLLAEARAIFRLKDERGLFSDLWAMGLMRRAALEVGRRLAAQGKIKDQAHALDAAYAEMIALLRGTGGPSAAELAERSRKRLDPAAAKDAPEFLGPRDMGPPPADWFPAAARRTAKATEAIVSAIFKEAPKQASSQGMVCGIPASKGIYEGVVRILNGPEDFSRIRQGEVAVARSTSPAFNIVLPLLGALVAERGGSLSHAAVVAREYGIPGVVSARGALTLLRDGDRVRVNGDTGEIEVLG